MTRSITGFGAALERICSANGLTQKDIAAQIGVAPETVTRWKSDFSPPSDDLFRALDALRKYEPGLTADELVGRVSVEAEG
jgi:transcriptional regulator with XRE-family HTH domain